MKKKKIAEAEEIMLIIEDGLTEPDEVRKSIQDQEASMDLAGQVKFFDFCKMDNQRTLNRTILAVISLVGLQLTGVNAITFYTNTIFGDYLNLKPDVAKPLAAVYQMTSIIGGILSAYTVERFGRRTLMMISAAGNSICMAFLAGLLTYPDNKQATQTATFFVYLYHFLYVIGWGGIPFLYASEISPLPHRTTINGLAVAGFWAFNFMIAEVSPNEIGANYTIVWACTNAALVVVVYFFFPETSGRSLEEIDNIFAIADGWLNVVKVAKRMPQRHLNEVARNIDNESTIIEYEHSNEFRGKPLAQHEEKVETD